MKPLLLIDVDGPLNPYASSNRKLAREKAFRLYKLMGFKVWLNPWHGEELNKLADVYDLTWCTTWEHHANTMIGPKIGLPELPVIEFPESLSKPDSRIYWKTPTVLEYAAGRPFAWIDDEIGLWDEEYVQTKHDGHALLRMIDPADGLHNEDFAVLEEWAAKIAG